ncbi:hypothetical protein L1285_22850 [Pseudoalteromonas sp. DL2-H2.2]|uniref:hypothetical protein n=1 Tax=Pseudoalteromonas sp. DL2-H2.2 TaxID=2908889 RepID=UPI001F2A94A5|nr:hypothetical protein [Pseudoalteromonas sp. DL2-H2.2]MCF2911143.1 hypothetical protein [Pseudoalteromonas sp. DL2-H2.2]
MKRIQLSIPFSVDLTEESAWEALNEKCTSFGIVRCHFQLNERILNEPHQVGESLAVYKSPKGVGSQHVISSSFELEEVRQINSIEKFLFESESTAKFASELAAKIGFSKENSITGKLKSELSEKLKQSVMSSVEINESQKIRETTSFEITNTIDPNVTDPIVAVPVFKRKSFDLLLGHVDFLRVDYEREMLGLRKKSKKTPKIIDFNSHPNRIEFGIPLATIKYWEFLPKSSALMLEDEHEVQVENSEQLSIEAPHCEKRKFVKFPDVPSLYQIANAAFPLKWILRKAPDNQWTEDKLRKIELDEVKNTNNGWWRKYGRSS